MSKEKNNKSKKDLDKNLKILQNIIDVIATRFESEAGRANMICSVLITLVILATTAKSIIDSFLSIVYTTFNFILTLLDKNLLTDNSPSSIRVLLISSAILFAEALICVILVQIHESKKRKIALNKKK